MGPDRRLQPGPLNDTVAAVKQFLNRAKDFGLATVPAYGTSAVRKAANPEDLILPLKALGVETCILSEEDEGRWNLCGALAQGLPSALVLDPGGDSSELCGGSDWRTAPVASLPFGSVSLQEKYGSGADNKPLPWSLLERVAAETAEVVRRYPPARPFLGQSLVPAIRMNPPIQRALEQANGQPPEEHGEGGVYAYEELEVLTRAVARLDHAGRAALMAGEPLGKVDRTSYGFASWLGTLQALGAKNFTVEPWGIKLGAAIVLN
jgi:exopolyphosphatase/pppGpp-phosphohydrolase